jgi:hypothetical protein
MRIQRTAPAGLVVLALAVGTAALASAQTEADVDTKPVEAPAVMTGSPSSTFPTGLFVSVEDGRAMLEFHRGGSGEWSDVFGSGWFFTYAVDGDVLTWSTAPFHSLSEAAGGPRHFDDATYRWDYDGEWLAFELIGEDPSDRREELLKRPFRPIEDPRVVMVATFDLDVGDPIRAWKAFVPAAEAGPDAYTIKTEYLGHVAAVPIAKGQPITPDIVELPAE